MNNIHLAKKTSKKVTFINVQQTKKQTQKTSQNHLDFSSFINIQPKQQHQSQQSQQSQHTKQQQLPILTKIQPQKTLNFNQFPLLSEQTDEDDDEVHSTNNPRKIIKNNEEGQPKKKIKLTEQDEKIEKPNSQFINGPLFSNPNFNPKSNPLFFGINQISSSKAKQPDKIIHNHGHQSSPFSTNITIPSISKPLTNPTIGNLPFPMLVSSLPFQNKVKPVEPVCELFPQNHSIFPISKTTPLLENKIKSINIPIVPLPPLVSLAPLTPFSSPPLPSNHLPPQPLQNIYQQTYILNQSQPFQNINPTNFGCPVPQIIMTEEELNFVQTEVNKIQVNMKGFLKSYDHSLHLSEELLADCKLQFSRLLKMTNLNRQLKMKAIAQQRQINCLNNQSENLQSEIEFLKQFCKTIKPRSTTESQELLQLLSENQLGIKMSQIMKNDKLEEEISPKAMEVEVYYISNLIERAQKLMDLVNMTFDEQKL